MGKVLRLIIILSPFFIGCASVTEPPPEPAITDMWVTQRSEGDYDYVTIFADITAACTVHVTLEMPQFDWIVWENFQPTGATTISHEFMVAPGYTGQAICTVRIWEDDGPGQEEIRYITIN